MDALFRRSQGNEDDANKIKVGDLGMFSMKEIYEALAGIQKAQQDALVRTETVDSRAEDSDSSWTLEEETGDFHMRVRRMLDAFVLAPDQITMTTDVLTRRQRRFVHATAQVMRLGHASLGPPSKNRRMVIFKGDEDTIPEDPQEAGTQQHIAGAEIETTVAPSVISATESSQSKRRRLGRVEGGYACQFHPCTKVFDRASERNKHEQAHQPAFTSRHQCKLCNRGFRYPKDVRRHMARVHESAASRPIFDSAYASLGSASMALSSNLTYESRVPSETSLTFNSNPTSQHTSPVLLGQRQAAGVQQEAIEPLMLGTAETTAYSGCGNGELDLPPWPEWADFEFDQQDVGNEFGDEGFLEMAIVRK